MSSLLHIWSLSMSFFLHIFTTRLLPYYMLNITNATQGNVPNSHNKQIHNKKTNNAVKVSRKNVITILLTHLLYVTRWSNGRYDGEWVCDKNNKCSLARCAVHCWLLTDDDGSNLSCYTRPPEMQNIKCFTQTKSFKPNFTPRKVCKSQQI